MLRDAGREESKGSYLDTTIVSPRQRLAFVFSNAFLKLSGSQMGCDQLAAATVAPRSGG